MLTTLRCRYFQRAFGWSVPIGGLAGLIGLGGGEFRLPILTQVIGFPTKAAIPLNLLISLVTLAVALVFRHRAIPVGDVMPHLPEITGLACGGMISALYGAKLVMKLSDHRLKLATAILLAALGVLLLVEAFVPLHGAALGTDVTHARFIAGVLIGLLVGIVSSMLGVAGGELLIPTLVFIFAADIKIAGTASLMISLMIVTTGLWRYYRSGALQLTGGASRVVGAMSAGSMVGAGIGAFAVAFAPTAALKVVLGLVLIVAAWKTAHHGK